MYAVLCRANILNQIENLISKRDEEILIKNEDEENFDIIEEFKKIERTPIKHVILDVSLVKDNSKIIYALNSYKIKNDKTQIIIIAENIQPPNELMHKIVIMGIYDIIVSQGEDLLRELTTIIDHPSPYKKAVKWIIDGYRTDISGKAAKVKNNSKGKTIIKVEEKIKPVYIDKVKTEIVTKEIVSNQIISFLSFQSSGSTFLSNILTQSFAERGYKVTLINFYDNSTKAYLNIEETQKEKIMDKINKDKYDEAFEECIQLENIDIISLDKDIDTEKFNKMLSYTKGKSDVILIDPCKREDIKKISLLNSNLTLYVFELSVPKMLEDIEILKNLKEKNVLGNVIGIVNKWQENTKCYEFLSSNLRQIGIDKFSKIRNLPDLNDYILLNNLWSFKNIDDKLNQDIDVLMEKLKARSSSNKNKKIGLTNTFQVFLLAVTSRKFIYALIFFIALIFLLKHFNLDISKFLNLK